MSKQLDISPRMREILIDWLIEVHLKFKLHSETLYLTVNLLDRFLEKRAVDRKKLQLVGCTAMLLAAKYEEVFPPEVDDFTFISDEAYNRGQIIAMESIMLNTLSFNLTTPSALRFLERFLKVADASPTVSNFATYLLESTLQEYSMLKYLPSQLAAASVWLAQYSLGIPAWNDTLRIHTGQSEQTLESCVRALHVIATREPNEKYRAVRKKYGQPKFGSVSSLPVGPLASNV
jgi:transcription initiation factor TFIIIB Brf1 subunit/transcription initiation factor TFIIB